MSKVIRVWYELTAGESTVLSKADMPEDACVDDLKQAIKNSSSNMLKNMDAPRLQVFAANGTTKLEPYDPIPTDTTGPNRLVVIAPQKQSKQHYLVLSVSEVAKDPQLRAEFRDQQVAEEPCRGGFIAQKFYLEFVLAAQEFETFERKDSVVEEVAKLGEVLAVGSRKKHSLFNNSYLDEEAPQSAVGSELFRLAIDLLQQDRDTKDQMRLRVTHQQHLVTNIASPDSSPQEFKFIRKRKRESGKLKSKPVEDKKSLDQIDICAWFVHPERTLGACVLAACEYKPSGIQETERKAQADMYGSNILILHQKPCIVIDIAGANDLEHWTVSAYGLVQAQFTKKSHLWETSPLYVGRGAEAIVMVARGLLAAQESFPSRLEEHYGSRLGPVVGKIDEFVYKVYDMAQHRKPNIDVVRMLLDKDAELLISNDTQLEIVKMKWIPSDWKKNVSTEVFEEIIRKLRLLHENFGPHGDIRLANLLSCGSIIDFDFVRAERYPSTLNSISQDGTRHPDVEDMIHRIQENGDESSLIQPETSHDWFSLGQVMRLFQPTDESNASSWESFCEKVEKGELEPNPNMPNFDIELKDRDMPLAGAWAHSR